MVASIGKVLYDAIVETIGNRPVYSGAAICVSREDWEQLVEHCKRCGPFSNYVKGWDRHHEDHVRSYVCIGHSSGIAVHLMPDGGLASGEYSYFGIIYRLNGLQRAVAGVGD